MPCDPEYAWLGGPQTSPTSREKMKGVLVWEEFRSFRAENDDFTLISMKTKYFVDFFIFFYSLKVLFMVLFALWQV
jgi:hypothetical protein